MQCLLLWLGSHFSKIRRGAVAFSRSMTRVSHVITIIRKAQLTGKPERTSSYRRLNREHCMTDINDSNTFYERERVNVLI